MNKIAKNEKIIQFNNRFLSCQNVLEIEIDTESSEVVFYYNNEENNKVKRVEFLPYEYYFIKAKIEKCFNLESKTNSNFKNKYINKIKERFTKWQKFFMI